MAAAAGPHEAVAILIIAEVAAGIMELAIHRPNGVAEARLPNAMATLGRIPTHGAGVTEVFKELRHHALMTKTRVPAAVGLTSVGVKVSGAAVWKDLPADALLAPAAAGAVARTSEKAVLLPRRLSRVPPVRKKVAAEAVAVVAAAAVEVEEIKQE